MASTASRTFSTSRSNENSASPESLRGFLTSPSSRALSRNEVSHSPTRRRRFFTDVLEILEEGGISGLRWSGTSS